MRKGDSLSTAQWTALQAVFDRALQAGPRERSELVEQARAHDPLIGDALAAMLVAHDQMQGRTANALEDMQRQAHASTLLSVGDTIGPYRVLALLGEGGFGAVYEAEQELPVRRRVALKVIKPGMDTGEVIARFKAERQALALMNHPHIARVFDAGATDSGRPYFVMELVQGEAISTYCRRHGLGIEQRLELFDQVCAAVQHANANGVIHRDLKPNNMLVGDHDGKPFARIIDFGIAKAASGLITDVTLLTERFGVMGTPAFMSPEQAEGRADIDARTDVYSLGVTLYELLTDTTPLDEEAMRAGGYAEVIRSIREVDPPLPSVRLLQSDEAQASDTGGRTSSRKRSAQVRGDLDWIVMKAIEKDRRRRYESVGELASDLRRHVSGQPVLAAPPSITYRLGKIARRHRTGMMTAALAIALTTIAVLAFDRRPVSGSAPEGNAAVPAPGKSVAVLPFANLSTDKDSAFFADGMQDTILTKLSGIGGLKVIASASTAGFGSHPANLRQIAAQLGVAAILEGSVQKSGSQVLINIQLIDARNNQHLWAQDYKRTLDNVFDVEGDVAASVADALDAKLTVVEKRAVEAKPTTNPVAYEAYLRGLALASSQQPDAPAAAIAFEQAVHLDPGFVPAWSWLSRQHAWMAWTGEDPSVDHNSRAREAMETVDRLAPGSVESLVAKGFYRYRVEHDFQGARQIFEQAHALSPNNLETVWPLAMIARRQGRWPEAVVLLEQAMSIDPRDPLTAGTAQVTYEATRDWPNAQRVADRASTFGTASTALAERAYILLKKGDLKTLKQLFDQLRESRDVSQNDWFPSTYFEYARDYAGGIAYLRAPLAQAISPDARAEIDAGLGELYRLAGDTRSARSSYEAALQFKQGKLKTDPDDDSLLRDLATIEAGLGEEEAALAYAHHAAEIDDQRGDRYQGPKDLETRARIQARFGNKDAAITALQQLLRTAYEDPVTAATLRLDPDWDGLRQDPRFKQLLEDDVHGKTVP